MVVKEEVSKEETAKLIPEQLEGARKRKHYVPRCVRNSGFSKTEGKLSTDGEGENGKEVGRSHVMQTVYRHMKFILNAMRSH